MITPRLRSNSSAEFILECERFTASLLVRFWTILMKGIDHGKANFRKEIQYQNGKVDH